MSSKPAFWAVLAVLSFVAGVAIIAWGEFTYEPGDSGASAGVGGGLVALGAWSGLRARVLAKQSDEASLRR